MEETTQSLCSDAVGRHALSPGRRLIAWFTVLAFVALVSRVLYARGLLEIDGLLASVSQHPALAPVAFVFVYAAFVILMLPTLPLNVGAGAMWGAPIGGAIATLGSTLGAFGTFLVARGLVGQPLAGSVDRRVLARLQSSVSHGGWKVVAFVRLNPIFPGPVNALLGMTSISWRTFAWSTPVFLAAPTFLFAFLGSQFGALYAGDGAAHWASRILWSSFAVALLGTAAWMTRVGINDRSLDATESTIADDVIQASRERRDRPRSRACGGEEGQ